MTETTGINSCPIEGFSKSKAGQTLKLVTNEYEVTVVVSDRLLRWRTKHKDQEMNATHSNSP